MESGLANVYLPRPPNPFPHVMTSHPPKDTTKPTAPLKDFRLPNLYKGTTIQTMFKPYAKAFKETYSTQNQEIVSTMDVDNLLQSNTGLEFFQNVYRRLEQDLMKKLPTGYRCTDGSER